MSINLQKRLRERKRFGTSPGLPYRYSRRAFVEQVYSDKYLISQLTCERELSGHAGCVNTLDWSLEGDKLLSGSDDKKLNIYKPFENYKIATVINTGHRANIFSAKFMPQTSDNVIISGAGDSEVRIFDLQNMDSPLFSMYVCHSDQVKKICVYDDNPNEFLTCSKDGTVRQFDLRVPHICSPHSVRSFLTARKKPAVQFPQPKGDNIHHGCPKPILDYSKYNTELNSMTINKLFPHYFAVAGMNDYIYLHDRRMMPSNSTEFGSNDPLNSLKCIKRFSPTLDGFSRPNKHITACKFSDSNGYELIGSWSSDGIYLFNINDPPVQSSQNTVTANNKRKNNDNGGDNSMTADSTEATSTAAENSENDVTGDQKVELLWMKIVSNFLANDLTSTISVTTELLAYVNSCDLSVITDPNLVRACVYFVRAAIMALRLQECNLPQNINVDSNEINENIETAETLAPNNWKGTWCKAIGYWILGGGTNDNGNNERSIYLPKALEYGRQAKTMFHDLDDRNAQPSFSSSTATGSTSTATNDTPPLTDEVYKQMIYAFLQDVELACTRGGYIESAFNIIFESELEPEERQEQYRWLNFMLVNQVNSSMMFIHNIYPSIPTSSQPLSYIDQRDHDYTSSPSEATSDMAENEENATAMEEDEESLYTQIMSGQIMRGQIRDIYRHTNETDSDEEDSDFDLDAINILHENVNYPSFATDVGIVKPRMKYSGHCNIETVKEVDFYGLRDEYIVSGSDKGYVFIWDKKTGEIVQILHGDEDVVNVTKGHPFLPMMAVSGIDSTVKIFKPTSRLPTTLRMLEPNNPNSYSTSSRLYDIEEIVSANRESNRSMADDIYMTRSVYAAFLRMERQRRLLFVNGILEDEDEADDDRTLNVFGDEFEESSTESI